MSGGGAGSGLARAAAAAVAAGSTSSARSGPHAGRLLGLLCSASCVCLWQLALSYCLQQLAETNSLLHTNSSYAAFFVST